MISESLKFEVLKDERKRKRNERIQNIQIGMGTVNNGVVPSTFPLSTVVPAATKALHISK